MLNTEHMKNDADQTGAGAQLQRPLAAKVTLGERCLVLEIFGEDNAAVPHLPGGPSDSSASRLVANEKA